MTLIALVLSSGCIGVPIFLIKSIKIIRFACFFVFSKLNFLARLCSNYVCVISALFKIQRGRLAEKWREPVSFGKTRNSYENVLFSSALLLKHSRICDLYMLYIQNLYFATGTCVICILSYPRIGYHFLIKNHKNGFNTCQYIVQNERNNNAIHIFCTFSLQYIIIWPKFSMQNVCFCFFYVH